MKTTTLPENFLRCMSAEDRKLLGKGGMTADEALEKYEARNEKQLQEQICNYLRLHGIWFARSRMDRATTNGLGQPDFIASLPREKNYGMTYPSPVAIEVKFGNGELSDDQERVREQMLKCGWEYHVVRTFQEAVNAIGLCK